MNKSSCSIERKIIICGSCSSIISDRINTIFSINNNDLVLPLVSEIKLTLFTDFNVLFVNKESYEYIQTYWLPFYKDNNLTIPIFIIAYNANISNNPIINEAQKLANIYNAKLYYILTNDINNPYYNVEWSIICGSILLDNIPNLYNPLPSKSLHWENYINKNNTSILITAIVKFLILCDSKEQKHLDFSGLELIGNPFPNWFYKALGSIHITNLNLSNNKLTEISSDIQYLSNLEILELSYNQLEYLPPELSNISSLRKLKVKGNPLLSIPKVSLKSSKSLISYLQSLKENSTTWTKLKLILVGTENVGKTTLLTHLLQQKTTFKSLHNFTGNLRKLSRENPPPLRDISTDGIDISYWCPSDITFNCWDFAGQNIFYPTHQFFLSGRSIYLLVFNLLDPNSSNIDYWLSQISAISSFISYVIIIGTHADNPICTEEYINSTLLTLKKTYQHKYPFIHGYYITSIDDKSTYSTLSSFIINKITKKHKLLQTKVPGSWQAFDNAISQKRNLNIQLLSIEEFNILGSKFGINCNQINIVKEFLHDVGSIINLPNRSFVVINPSWLSNIMKCVITLKHKWINDGILLKSNWKHIWAEYPISLHSQIFSLLESFEVAHEIVGEPQKALIPCLLPETIPDISLYWKPLTNWKSINSYRYGRVWKFAFIPIGMFARVLVRFLHFKEGKILSLWKNGILMSYHDQLALLTNDIENNSFILQVRTTKPGLPILMQKALQSVNSLLETMFTFRVDQKAIFVPCIHCWELNITKQPYLFPIEDIILSLSKGYPFVYCNNLSSRKVRIDHLAPDMIFSGIKIMDKESILIEYELGKGGFSTVYKGKMNTRNPPDVAIKELKKDSQEIIELYSSFQHEIQIMSCLDHPNIVKLIGITNYELSLSMILEYVPCGTLFNLIHNKNITLDLGLRIRIALDIAKGMYYLHCTTPPYIHRDLRSPNILIQSIDKNDTVLAKVADFGLTCCAPKISGILSTWQWHAPEVISSKSKFYDEKIDVYSFGIILWELITRQYPFEEYSNDKRFCRIIKDDFGNQRLCFQEIQIKDEIENNNLRPTIPSTISIIIKELIENCWSSNAKNRYSFENIVNILSNHLKIYNECDPQIVNLHTFRDPNQIRNSYLQSNIKFPKPYKNNIKANQLFSYSYSIPLPPNCNPLCLIVACGNVWCGCDTGDILIWNTIDKKLIKAYKPHNSCIYSLLVVGDQVWSSSENFTIFIWDIDDYSKQNTLHTNEYSVRKLILDYFPRDNGKQYVWSCSPNGAIQMWDTQSFICVKSIELGINRCNFITQISRKEVWVAADNYIVILSEELEELNRFRAHDKKINNILLFNKRIWTCSDDKTISIWNDNGILEQKLEVHLGKINCLLRIGNYILSGSSDNSIIIWNAEDNKPVQELIGYNNACIKCLIATGSTIWAGSFDKTVVIWQLS